jgi:hypothetical protein
MTNSAPHAGALWLEGAEMARWIEPASRAIDTDALGALRLALTRSGAALACALRTPWTLPRFALPAPGTALAPAPRLAFAGTGSGAGLLDSGAAFP